MGKAEITSVKTGLIIMMTLLRKLITGPDKIVPSTFSSLLTVFASPTNLNPIRSTQSTIKAISKFTCLKMILQPKTVLDLVSHAKNAKLILKKYIRSNLRLDK